MKTVICGLALFGAIHLLADIAMIVWCVRKAEKYE